MNRSLVIPKFPPSLSALVKVLQFQFCLQELFSLYLLFQVRYSWFCLQDIEWIHEWPLHKAIPSKHILTSFSPGNCHRKFNSSFWCRTCGSILIFLRYASFLIHRNFYIFQLLSKLLRPFPAFPRERKESHHNKAGENHSPPRCWGRGTTAWVSSLLPLPSTTSSPSPPPREGRWF